MMNLMCVASFRKLPSSENILYESDFSIFVSLLALLSYCISGVLRENLEFVAISKKNIIKNQ